MAVALVGEKEVESGRVKGGCRLLSRLARLCVLGEKEGGGGGREGGRLNFDGDGCNFDQKKHPI